MVLRVFDCHGFTRRSGSVFKLKWFELLVKDHPEYKS